MTEETSPPLASAKVKPQARRRQWLALLVLLLLIALAVVGWCGWQQLSQEQASLTQSLQQWQSGQRAQAQALQADVQQAQTQLASLQDQVLLHGQKLATLGKGGTTLWLLNEAKSLASLAQQRLLLTADLPATQQLLAAGDKVLAQIDDPRVLPARRALAQDIQKLAAAQQLDTTALLLQLGALINQMQSLTLPEASDKSAAAPMTAVTNTTEESTTEKNMTEAGWWQRLLARLPLSIRRSNAALPLPLAPAQLAQARLSLEMNLQQAQLALLQGRAPVYAQALTQAQATLSDYFASDDASVKSLQQALAKLKAVHINQALPQIGAGLEAINALLQADVRPTPAKAKGG